MLSKVFIVWSLFVSVAYGENVFSYCVGNLSLPKGPAGYPCKDASKVTMDDFVSSRLSVAANTTSSPFKVGLTSVFDANFPGLNGLGLSIARVDIDVGGVVPLHTHRTSELNLVIEGSVIAGLIGPDNTPYYKQLNKGDITIVPPSLLHFVINVGDTPALIFATLNSANPGLQIFDTAMFGNSLPTSMIEKITFLDAQQVKKLKAIFGGTN